MAEIDLVSSHHPWAPLPRLVDWDELGDGSVFDGMPEEGESADEVFRDPDAVRQRLRRVDRVHPEQPDLLRSRPTPTRTSCCVVLGDHQPHSYVSGHDAGHDVPISVIAQDPAVMYVGSRPGTGSPASTPPPTPPSGGWTPSATGSWRPTPKLMVEVRGRPRPSLEPGEGRQGGDHNVGRACRGPVARSRVVAAGPELRGHPPPWSRCLVAAAPGPRSAPSVTAVVAPRKSCPQIRSTTGFSVLECRWSVLELTHDREHAGDRHRGRGAGCRACRVRSADRAEADLLQAAVDWAAMHSIDSIDEAATLIEAAYGDAAMAVAGAGAPLVAEFAVTEFAAAIGMSTDAGKRYVGHALELGTGCPGSGSGCRPVSCPPGVAGWSPNAPCSSPGSRGVRGPPRRRHRPQGRPRPAATARG